MKNLDKLLNKEQYEAVTNIDGAFLILAGAGSGKTRVITHKIAYMISKGVKPESILGVTFTNKAAKEMNERVSKLVSQKGSKVLITTFHSLGVRILKKEITKLDYRQKFSIYDEYDCKKIIMEVLNELKLSPEKYDPKWIPYKISEIKMNLSSGDIEDANIKNIYDKYQKYLINYNALDFDDLIKLPIEIFEKFPDVLNKYKKQWKYILIDEYQDTSFMQYKFIKHLAMDHKNISIVGDDDQSIYSWRGANPENIIMFEKDFCPVKEVRLEQNYRSTENILNAANTLITFNSNRKSKTLWTKNNTGEKIKIYQANDEEDEANYVFTIINRLVNNGYKYNDIAILFRMNSQSRPFEEVLRENDIPYKLIGGTKFFDRQEIRDILSYMRFFANAEDEVSLFRIINNPKRGIGNTTILSLLEHAKRTNSSVYGTIKDFTRSNTLGNRITPYLEDFYKLVEKYKELIHKPKNIAKTVQKLIDEIDYRGKLITELKDLKKIGYRMNNINQLIQSISRYENNPDNFEPNIYEYLQRVSLQNRDDEDNDNNTVNMLSIHSAKGLEFKIVFVVGVEEGLLPHNKTLEESGSNEEERRLFYVAITRAQERLYLSYPKMRMKFGETMHKSQSEFLAELPDGVFEEMDMENSNDAPTNFGSLLNKWNN